MKLNDIHSPDKEVSASLLFSAETGKVTAIQLLKGALLKEHITKVPALLVCVIGVVVFENENGESTTIQPGHYVNIEPLVKHWIIASEDSQLLLLK